MGTCCPLANRLALQVTIVVPNQCALLHCTCRFAKVNVNKVEVCYGIVLILVAIVPFDVHFNYIDNVFTT